MATTSGVETQVRDLISGRLAELDSERKRLERALDELTNSPAPKRRGRPPKSASASSGAPAAAAAPARRRRRRKGGTRSEQAVKLIAENPGISASEVAKQMKIKPNYLYRVLGDLEKQGLVKKDGRKYTAVQADS